MNTPRRLFLTQASIVAGAAVLKPGSLIAKNVNNIPSQQTGITIYHTNDLAGNIGAVYKNLGGLQQIKSELKKADIKGTLLDAGGFINPGQSIAQTKQFIYAMNTAGYQAAGISKNELACGADQLASLIPLMQFTLVNCNNQFDGKLAQLIKPYTIINHGAYKIGVTGVSSPLKGAKYRDAIESANQTALILKNSEKCDLVICLSHLGNNPGAFSPDNTTFATKTENIDLIIAGNNNQLLSNAQVLKNSAKHEVIVAQAGWKGLMFGRTIIDFDNDSQKKGFRAKHYIPGLAADKSYAATVIAMQQSKNINPLT